MFAGVPTGVMRCWARSLASVVPDWPQVTSLCSPPCGILFCHHHCRTPPLSFSPVRSDPLLSPHRFMTSLHRRLHSPPGGALCRGQHRSAQDGWVCVLPRRARLQRRDLAGDCRALQLLPLPCSALSPYRQPL